MSKRNKTLLRKELEGVSLEEMVVEALADTGATHRCGQVFAGELDVCVIVAVGPAAEAWMEQSDNYSRMVRLSREGGGADAEER